MRVTESYLCIHENHAAALWICCNLKCTCRLDTAQLINHLAESYGTIGQTRSQKIPRTPAVTRGLRFSDNDYTECLSSPLELPSRRTS